MHGEGRGKICIGRVSLKGTPESRDSGVAVAGRTPLGAGWELDGRCLELDGRCRQRDGLRLQRDGHCCDGAPRFAGPPHVENNGDGAAATDAHHNDDCNDHKEQNGCRGIGRFVASRAVGEGDGSALGIAVGDDNGSMLGIAVGEGYVQGGVGSLRGRGRLAAGALGDRAC